MYHRPAVVLSALDDIYLVAPAALALKAAWAVLGLENQIRSRLPGDTLRIPISICPDLGPRALLVDERIILRHRTVVIQTEYLSCKRVELLCQFPLGRISGRN